MCEIRVVSSQARAVVMLVFHQVKDKGKRMPLPNLCVVCFILIDAHIDCFLVAMFYFCRIDDTLTEIGNVNEGLSAYLP